MVYRARGSMGKCFFPYTGIMKLPSTFQPQPFGAVLQKSPNNQRVYLTLLLTPLP